MLVATGTDEQIAQMQIAVKNKLQRWKFWEVLLLYLHFLFDFDVSYNVLILGFS